ncbi:single-stranded DNA-binding protein [Coprococcus catus]|uniref:single-stranded DNA-binding protein n=1 Tax=Coprococcus catus TaxID=116085 RepID=UPI001D0765D9|nr:single-stranded DNA-binding protein [Coprococcus catus]MCB6493127.1 single-stranded DNA-binding protein [Coprococcus catus]
MNNVILSGRLTRDPEVRHSQNGNEDRVVARYTLAVDRIYSKENQQADFINCVEFGKLAEFAEKYFYKGIKLIVRGRIQTGSYTNRDGVKIYTTDIIVESHEFAESKRTSEQNSNAPISNDVPAVGSDGFMNIPDGLDEELPFS